MPSFEIISENLQLVLSIIDLCLTFFFPLALTAFLDIKMRHYQNDRLEETFVEMRATCSIAEQVLMLTE